MGRLANLFGDNGSPSDGTVGGGGSGTDLSNYMDTTFYGGNPGPSPSSGSPVQAPTQAQTTYDAGPTSANANPSGTFFSNKPPDQNLGPQVVAPQTPAAPQGYSNSTNDPLQWITGALNSGSYGNPQAAIDAMNGLGTPGFNGYASYNSSSNTVGVPYGQYGGYLTQNPAGQWGYVGHIGPDNGGGGASTGTGLTPGSGTGFADPAYQQLADMVQQRLNSLSQPVQFPDLSSYMSMLQQEQTAAKQRAQTFADQLTTRIGQLQQPLLTTANVANQRALASNNLLASKDTALANARANVAARGFDPNTSGIALDQANQIGQQYTNAQSNIDAQLQEAAIAQDEQRRNQATQLQGLVQSALQGGDVTALQSAATMSDLENQLFNIDQNRQREALSTAQIPVDLTNQGFSNALNASNSTTNPLGMMLALASLGNQQQGLQQTASNSNMSALAWLIQQGLSL